MPKSVWKGSGKKYVKVAWFRWANEAAEYINKRRGDGWAYKTEQTISGFNILGYKK